MVERPRGGAGAGGALREAPPGRRRGARHDRGQRLPRPRPGSRLLPGLLQRRPAISGPNLLVQVGKEGGQVSERVAGTVTNAEAVPVVAAPDEWTELVVPVLRDMGVAEVMRRTDLALNDRFARYLAGTMRPKGRRRAALRAAALDYARERLTDPDAIWSWDERAILAHAASMAAREKEAQRCTCGCGAAPAGRSKWAGEACRKRAARERDRAELPSGHKGGPRKDLAVSQLRLPLRSVCCLS